MLLLLALACQPDAELNPIQDEPGSPAIDPDGDADPGGNVDEETSEGSTPYTYESDDEDAPLLSMAEVAMGVEQVIEVLMVLDGPELHDTYQMFRDDDEHLCPMTYPYYGYDYWYDECTTSDGVQFSGYAYGYNYEPYNSGYYQYERSAYIYGDGTITRADGTSFEIAGYSSTYEYILSNGTGRPRYAYHYMYGDFAWSNYEDDPTNWMDDGYTVDYTMYSGYSPEADGHYVSYQGGVSGIDGVVNSVVFDEFYLHDEGFGADCSLEPSGTVSVRDDDGRWYVVEFQGAYYNGGAVFSPDCDGCGDVWQGGELLGEACPDFYTLLDWEDVPWNR